MFQFRTNIGPNSLGAPPGDRQFIGILNVAPIAGTTVTATQGGVTRALPLSSFTVFPTMFRVLEPFDPALTGSWSITATNGSNTAGPLVTPPIANPQLLPLAQNLQVVGTGPTPTVTWSFPDLTGIDVERLRFRVYNDLNDDAIFNEVIPLGTTSFTVPSGLLFPGIPYIFCVPLEDTEPGSTENNSVTCTQSAYFVPEPLHINLLVSSELTDSVRRYEAETGAYLGEFVSAGVDGPVEPSGLTFGPDGDLYVAGGGDGNRNVRRFNGRTGAFIDIVTPVYPSQIEGLAFGPHGKLYGSVFDRNFVFEVDPKTGNELRTIGAGSPLDGATGLTFGADGNLYVGSFNTGEVLRFDATTGAYLGVFATVPSGGSPRGLRFGPDGDLYVLVWYCGPAGCLASDIMRFDGASGASKGSFIAPGDPHPVEPYSLVFGPDGKLYVSSYLNDRVLRYDGTTGVFIDTFVSGGGLDGPSGLAVTPAVPDIDLLVASRANGRVIRYDGATGAPVGNFVLPARDGLESPGTITYGPDGKLYVANGIKPDGTAPYATAVLRYDGESGQFIDVFCSGFPAPITGIAFGPDGNLYVNTGFANVVFRSNGTMGACSAFAGPGSPLNGATGLAFGPDGDLYVGSFFGSQVLRFDRTTGAYRGEFATVPIPGTDGHVGGVCFGPDGDLYVTLTDTGNDIWRFDGTTGTSKGSFLRSGEPHPDGPYIMLFGPNNMLYVSARDRDEVMRYNATTGAFIDVFATSGGPAGLGGLDSPAGMALPEPGASTQIGAELLALIALARRRCRGSRSRRNAQGFGPTRVPETARAQA